MKEFVVFLGGERYIFKVKVKKGENIRWCSRNFLGWKGIRWDGRNFRYEGYDGTEDNYYFSPFSNKIEDIEEIISIVYRNLTLYDTIEFIRNVFEIYDENNKKVSIEDIYDKLCDYIRSLFNYK